MRSFCTLALFILALTDFPAAAQKPPQQQQQDDDSIYWLDNYQEALKQAKATGKPIFLEYRCEP